MTTQHVLLTTVILACAACTPTATRSSTADGGEAALPAPVEVCVSDDAGLRVGRAVPRIGGVHSPREPISPQELNWMVDGIGCVTYPGPESRRQPCAAGRPSLPVVRRVLCMQ
jgi:hypothetical protein